MSKRWIKTLLPLALFLSLFLSSKCLAAEQNLILGPAIVNKIINPGQSANGYITITNQGNYSYNYSVYATPYGVETENYKPIFKTLPGFSDISNWFHFSQSAGYLNPSSTNTINYSINVPPGTSPGSYYAAVFAETHIPYLTPSKTLVQLNQRVGSLVYINVPGQATQKGKINYWHVKILQVHQVQADLKLENDGKLYYISNINVYFRNIFGGLEYKFVTQKIILPKVIRNIPVSWPDPPQLGLFKVNGIATIYGRQYLTTKYVLLMPIYLQIITLILLILVVLFVIIKVVKLVLQRRHTKYRIKK